MNSIIQYIRPDLRDVTPYSSARDEFEGEGEVFLDANENGLVTVFNRYPDPFQKELKKKIAVLKGFDSSQLVLGNGSDEILDLIYRLIGEPFKDAVAYLKPSYGMYSVLAKLNGLKTIAIPLNEEFSCSAEFVLEMSKNCKILILCNPNNPTARVENLEWMEEIISNFKGVVVVDEAYIDFCPEYTVVPLLAKYSNLIVAQTLSKAFGMAGLRIGMAITSTDWVSALNSIKPPYNLSEVAQRKALELLVEHDWSAIKSTIISERERLTNYLVGLKDVTVYPSAANFILFRIENADSIYQELVKKGVIVRNRGTQYQCANCLRVSVGTPEENDAFMQELSVLNGF